VGSLRRAIGALAFALVAACGAPGPSEMLIFIDGRAVTASGDSLLAFTRQGTSEIVVREEGEASVVVFSPQWDMERRIPLHGVASAPHQFAVLPDGRIVVEATDGRLVVVGADSTSTLALVEQSDRTGFVVAALGGVLHAVPDRAITLYNAQGNLRWRLPWQWHEGAYVSDFAVDGQGRIHMLAGESQRNTFVCFSLSRTTGEVIRFSEPGTAATFVVERMGETKPDSAGRWIGN
jgi:hypothetical protein